MTATWRTAVRITVGVLLVTTVVAAGYGIRNLRYAEWQAARVSKAGFAEKQVTVNGTTLNYAEGPDNGPPVLLIHGQVTDWRSWSRVLPTLAQRYHVFAIDCYGHGGSAHAPEKYTARALATDVRQFLSQVVSEPATVIGHSSGGLVAALVAAQAPEAVRAVVLEDPPFFSSLLPRAEKTFNHVALATTAHEFLRSGRQDFTTYYIRHDAMWDLFQGLKEPLQKMALSYRSRHPDRPVTLFALPPSFNQMFSAMDSYDPRFGEAFYSNSFHDGFDHAQTLREIDVPAVLIHTNWSYDDDGVLLAAMSGQDAARARALLDDVRFYDVDTGHSFHFDDPQHFDQILHELEDRLSTADFSP